MTATATLERIWIKRAHSGPMDAAETATLIAGKGIEGNADFDTRRHVTLLDGRRWEEARNRLDAPVDPSTRRANLLLSGITLMETRNRVLRVGSTRLLIRGETRPCKLMDELHPGLQEELRRDWGGGAWAEILDGGTISVGDPVGWEEE